MSRVPGVVASLLLACTNAAAPVDSKVAESSAKAGPAVVAPGVKPTPAPVAGEDWLVWWSRDGAWTTRWLRIEGEVPSVVGERKALIVGDGAGLWQVERADSQNDVKMCQCADEEPENCPVIGKVDRQGLRAHEVGGETTVEIREAAEEAEWGEDIERRLAVVGGTQARVTVESSESGYFCGAHGVHYTTDTIFDIAAGKEYEPAADWSKQLPGVVRRVAANAIQKDLNECEDKQLGIPEIMNSRLDFAGASLALKGGEPTITWKFAAEVMYICSPDYALTGTATTGLIPEAAPIGLGPVPAGVTRALADLGDAEALGLSRLELPEAARAAKVAAFMATVEQPWPKSEVKMWRLGTSPAQAKLEEGRRWTRDKEFLKAIAAFDEAIGLDRELASAYSGRGYARMLAGDSMRARADFMTALAKSADKKFQAAVWFNLGGLAVQANDTAAARKAYRKSQALRDTTQVKDALAALDAPK